LVILCIQTRLQAERTLTFRDRGAKTAMTLALRSPDMVANLISVDNAPVDAALKGDFANYVRGMENIQAAHVKKQSEADQILLAYEKVGDADGYIPISNT
jgi:hypothetical protein